MNRDEPRVTAAMLVEPLLERRTGQACLRAGQQAARCLHVGVGLAWIRQATGDPAGGLDAIGEAMQAAPVPPGLVNPVPAQRARLRLAQGDLAINPRSSAQAEAPPIGASAVPDGRAGDDAMRDLL